MNAVGALRAGTQRGSGRIQRPRPNPSARLRLVCFPYAGGGASIFARWPAGVPRAVEVVAVQPPGHGSRLLERPVATMEDLVGEAVDALRDDLDRPFALFGHSMGGLVAFEVARELRRQQLRAPLCLYASAREAPQLPLERSNIHELPDEEFRAAVAGYGATPAQVLADAEVMRLVEPALRADFAICERYEYVDEPPLACPVRAFRGLADPLVSRTEAAAWAEQTSADFSLRAMPGGHFYVHSAERVLLQVLAADLDACLRSEEGWS